MSDEELNRLSERIISCAFKVSNVLGCGFLEKVYQNALVHELRKSGLTVEAQRPVNIYYDGVFCRRLSCRHRGGGCHHS